MQSGIPSGSAFFGRASARIPARPTVRRQILSIRCPGGPRLCGPRTRGRQPPCTFPFPPAPAGQIRRNCGDSAVYLRGIGTRQSTSVRTCLFSAGLSSHRKCGHGRPLPDPRRCDRPLRSSFTLLSGPQGPIPRRNALLGSTKAGIPGNWTNY